MASKLACTTLGMKDVPLPWPIKKRVVEVPAIKTEVCVMGSSIPEWASNVVKYLDVGKLPKGKKEVRRIMRKVVRFILLTRFSIKGVSQPFTLMYLSTGSTICLGQDT